MVCGFVTIGGQKISKSKSNTGNSPAELIARYSADGLRYWATSCRLGTDTQFSENKLRASQRFLTKLRNAASSAPSTLRITCRQSLNICSPLTHGSWKDAGKPP